MDHIWSQQPYFLQNTKKKQPAFFQLMDTADLGVLFPLLYALAMINLMQPHPPYLNIIVGNHPVLTGYLNAKKGTRRFDDPFFLTHPFHNAEKYTVRKLSKIEERSPLVKLKQKKRKFP